jgi:hypothetical protein
VPPWIKPPGFAGLVKEGEEDRRTTCAGVASTARTLRSLVAPLDARLFEDLRQRMGVQFLGSGGTIDTRGSNLNIDFDMTRSSPRRGTAGG